MKLSTIAISSAIAATPVLGVPMVLRPTVTIPSPEATLVGEMDTGVEAFKGIPFAKPPTGDLRLRRPQRLTESLGKKDATDSGAICPQFVQSSKIDGLDTLPQAVLGKVLNTPIFQDNFLTLQQSEDCLTLHVWRPPGTKKGDKLPVLYWIFGGGFELGWSSMYPGTAWVLESMAMNQPIIYVAVSYRVGGFGFLPGKEVKEAGVGNLGLLDQRLGLEWVADNIESFGGDPDRVTIWGESAGAISVFDQMVLFDGNNTYKGKPLFHGGIMNSGSAIPVVDIDSDKAQAVYNTVAQAGGCDGEDDSLDCLRKLKYEQFLGAVTAPPGLLSYHSLALSYLPRPDNSTLTASPDALGMAGKYAKIPIIIGDQEDEGTLFGLFEPNITTKDQVIDYLHDLYFNEASRDQIKNLVSLYDDTDKNGSPFRTGAANNIFPQFKRLSAILGDLVFTLTRRVMLEIYTQNNKDSKAWSYLASYDHDTPIMGTFHASDLIQVFFGILPDYASRAFKNYYISFVNNLDPNQGDNKTYANWPEWKDGKKLMNIEAHKSKIITDDFRNESSTWISTHIKDLYF